MPEIRQTRGRCRQCKKIYEWAGPPKLLHAWCGRCHIPLERCKLLDAGEKVFHPPAVA